MQQLKHIKNKKKESWQIKKFREQIVVNVKCDTVVSSAMGRNKKIRTTFDATRACKKTLEIRKTTKLLALEDIFCPCGSSKRDSERNHLLYQFKPQEQI